MGRPNLAVLLLFAAVMVIPAAMDRGRGIAAASPAASSVPDEALRALEQRRYWRASRILQDYLAVTPDSSPRTLLLAAQAEAGWGHWSRVDALLSGRAWLDGYSSGLGRELLGRSAYEQGRWGEAERDLTRFLAIAPDVGGRERGLTALRLARALAESGKVAEAMAAYESAVSHLPQLEDWIRVFAAQAAAGAGDTAGVARQLALTDPELTLDWGWRIRVRAFRRAMAIPEALRVAESSAARLRAADLRAAAWAVAGELHLERRDTASAADAWRRAMAAAPSSSAAVDAARGLSALPGIGPDDHLRIGRIYLRHGNRDRAVEGFEAYLASGAGGAGERFEVRVELGRVLFDKGDYARAERALLALANEPGVPTRVGSEALYSAGRAQYRQGRPEEGKRTLVSIAARFPGETGAAKGLYLVGDLAHDDGKLEEARAHYREAVRTVADLYESGLAMMRLGGLSLLAGDYREAVKVYEDYLRSFPNGRRAEQAMYWAGRARLALGEEAPARDWLLALRRRDPLSYYGLRAADLLDQGFWDIPLDAEPKRRDDAEARIAAAMDRVDLLEELGRADAVDYEIERARRRFADDDGFEYALAEALNARGQTLTGIRIGWDLHRREGAWNPRLLRVVYPFPYQDMVLAEAVERELDPWLVAGLIRRESVFKAAIKSAVGATGLMQIMPATGQGLAKEAGVRPFRNELLEQPEINLHLGTLYMRQLLDRYGGAIVPVLAAYNAGPHRVARWRNFPEFSDEELFAERIPYAETREYVKIVQAHARIYQALYGGSSRSAGE